MATIYWKDIDIQLRQGNNSDIRDMVNEDAIQNSLTNIFETLQGTRRMLPDFAVSIYNLLFEPIDETVASTIGNFLLYAFTIWESRIVVDNVHITIDEDNNRYEVDVIYHIISSNSTQALTFSSFLQAR